MNCEVCALHETGETGQAARKEAIRHRRLLLAYLTQSDDAMAEIRAEINDCVDCLLRLSLAFVSINAAFTVASCGGDMQRAIAEVEQSLLTYMDQDPPDAADPTPDAPPTAP